MSEKYYREESRKDYWSKRPMTNEDLQTGAVMRMADSLEKMEKPWADLISDNKWLRGCYDRNTDTIADLRRSNAALKGVITKMKKHPVVECCGARWNPSIGTCPRCKKALS